MKCELWFDESIIQKEIWIKESLDFFKNKLNEVLLSAKNKTKQACKKPPQLPGGGEGGEKERKHTISVNKEAADIGGG